MSRPLAVDLCAGLGGWTDGLLAEGYDVIGFDIERHRYGSHQYPAQLVLQNILTLDGRQFRGHASLIVASHPCQRYSYMAMPWTRAKDLIRWHREEGHHQRIVELNALFDACLRIGREAGCPIVIENVRGAIPWVGRSRWNYGSFHLWGDVPALMPITKPRAKVPQFAGFNGGVGFNVAAVREHGGDWFNDPSSPGRQGGVTRSGTKQPGISGERDNGKGDRWFQDGAARHGSKSSARKAASARIAKIPLALASWIARAYFPR